MKICHLTSVHSFNDVRITIKECSSLNNIEHFDVHLIAPNTEVKEYKGIKIHGLENSHKNRKERIKKFTKKVYKKALEIDANIYHFHDPELIPIGIKLKKKGKKVIYDVHEDVPRQILEKNWINKYLRKCISFIFEKYENYSAKRFDAVITATPFINKRFIKNGINSVNVNNYPILKELQSDQGNSVCRSNIVAYIGGITEKRGVTEMVKAINLVEDCHLYLAGTFSDKGLERKVESLKGWDKVVNFGHIDRTEVSKVLEKSIAGLVLFHSAPNHYNAQPNKMFEYMSAGVPLIASNFELWKTIVESNNCGICVDPMDENEIAEAIKWIINNPEEARKMGRNGMKAVKDKYNWQAEKVKLINVYKNII